MSTKIVRPATMLGSASTLCLIRRMAEVLVEREEYRVRSRMLAYENIGSMVGTSGYWVRSLVNGYDDGNVSLSAGLNIMALYERLCRRVETDNVETAQRIAGLRRDILAAAPRALAEVAAQADRAPADEGLSLDVRPASGREVEPDQPES